MVAGRVDCVTGVLGCMMLVVLFALLRDPRRGKKLKLLSPWTLLLVMVASVLFVFVADAITQICGGCGCVLSGKNICLLGAQERVNALANRLRALGIRGGGKPGSFQGVWETEPTKLLLEEGFCQVS